jgi:tetratricopeptide (TPR) repeat protein
LRQGDLAFDGCSIGYISRIEAGLRVPSLQVIRRLASGVGVSESWLAIGVTDQTEPQAEAQLRDASIALRLDQVDDAEATYCQVAAVTTQPALLARAEVGLGQIAFRRGHAHDAIERLERAYTLDPTLDDAAATDTLGRCYARIGETDTAITLFREQLERATAAGQPADRLRFAVLLANALIDSGSFDAAKSLLFDILAETGAGAPVALARVHWSQSRLHALADEQEAAALHARKAFELLETTEHHYYRAKAHLLLAYNELESGNGRAALVLLREGRPMLGASPSQHDAAQFDIEAARALALVGHPEEAARLAMRAAAIAGDAHLGDLGRCYGELAAAFDEIGEPERAAEIYELALECLEGSPHPFHRHVLARYAQLLERTGREQEAFAVYKTAATLGAHEPAPTGVPV